MSHKSQPSVSMTSSSHRLYAAVFIDPCRKPQDRCQLVAFTDLKRAHVTLIYHVWSVAKNRGCGFIIRLFSELFLSQTSNYSMIMKTTKWKHRTDG